MLESVEIETTHFSQIFFFYTPENVRKAKVFMSNLKQALNFFNSTVFYNYNIFFCRFASNFCWCFYEASFG